MISLPPQAAYFLRSSKRIAREVSESVVREEFDRAVPPCFRIVVAKDR